MSGSGRSVRAGWPDFGWIGSRLGEAVDLPKSGVLRLKWSEAQQRQPVRMVFAGHDFARAFTAAGVVQIMVTLEGWVDAATADG